MSLTAIIGGTINIKEKIVSTPFGEPSSPLIFGQLNNTDVVFLARHGLSHTIPPHKVNYRANLWALKQAKAKNIIAVAAVGGITEKMAPEQLVIPDQIIDYTYDRKHTFFEDDLTAVTHIDFSWPYNPGLREQLVRQSRALGIDIIDGAVYAATQGPRLESAAEILRLQRDGCDIVGMTGMPEACLAKELDLNYACCSLVVNWAAGKAGQLEISLEEMQKFMNSGMKQVALLLNGIVPELSE